MKAFSVVDDDWRTGFQITFENGFGVSVQFAQMNYCDGGETSAEVAVLSPSGNLISIGANDEILASVSPEDLVGILVVVRKMDLDNYLKLANYIKSHFYPGCTEQKQLQDSEDERARDLPALL